MISRDSKIPVVLVRPVDLRDRTSSPSKTYRRILSATDGTPPSTAMVTPVRQIAAVFGFEVVALPVWDSHILDGAPLQGRKAGRPLSAEAALSSEDEVTAGVAPKLGALGSSGAPGEALGGTRRGDPRSLPQGHGRSHRDGNPRAPGSLAHAGWLTGRVAERVLRSAGILVRILRAGLKPERVPHHGDLLDTCEDFPAGSPIPLIGIDLVARIRELLRRDRRAGSRSLPGL